MRGILEKMNEFKAESVGVSLLAQVEERLGLGPLIIRGGHKTGDKGFKVSGVGAENESKLKLSGIGRHGQRWRMKMTKFQVSDDEVKMEGRLPNERGFVFVLEVVLNGGEAILSQVYLRCGYSWDPIEK